MSWHHNRDRLKQATEEATFLQHAVMDYKVKIKLDFTINRCVRTIRLLLDTEQKDKRKGTLPGFTSRLPIGNWIVAGEKPQVVPSAHIETGLSANNEAFGPLRQVMCRY